MANEPVTQPEVPALPEKPFYQAQSFWATVLTGIAGILMLSGKFDAVAKFIQVNQTELAGWISSGLGLWGVYATLTRTTVLTKGK